MPIFITSFALSFPSSQSTPAQHRCNPEPRNKVDLAKAQAFVHHANLIPLLLPHPHPEQLSVDEAATDTHEGTVPAAEGEEQTEIGVEAR